MSLLYLAGELMNHVGRGPNAVTANASADANFPLANLYAGRPRKPFSFDAAGSQQRVIVDTQLIANGTMEDGTGDGAGSTLDDWTDASDGSATMWRQTSKVLEGTYSMRLRSDTGTETAKGRQDVTVRSGERLKLSASLDPDHAGGSAAWGVIVFNRQTGRYLTSSGTWSSTAQYTSMTGTGSAAEQALSQTFQVESRADCGGLDTVTLRIIFQQERDGTNTANLYVDEVELIPALNFLGVFGHNIPPLNTPTWRSGSGPVMARVVFNSGGVGVVTQPNLYGYLDTPIYERFWDWIAIGTSLEAPRYGELVMGYAETLARRQSFGWSDAYQQPQARVVTPERDIHVASRGSHPVRAVTLPFTHYSLADRNEIRDEILARTDYGRLPMIIVPTSDEPDVIFGRAADSWGVKRRWNVISDDTLVVEEDPHMEWIDG